MCVVCVHVQSLMSRPPVTPLFLAHFSSSPPDLQPPTTPHAALRQNNNKQDRARSLIASRSHHSVSSYPHIIGMIIFIVNVVDGVSRERILHYMGVI